MKKSHPVRYRILAARHARKARTLAARRQVEALAALIAYRRAIMVRPRPGAFATFAAAMTRASGLAAALQSLRDGRHVDTGTLKKFGLVRVPPGVREITYTAANLRRA